MKRYDNNTHKAIQLIIPLEVDEQIEKMINEAKIGDKKMIKKMDFVTKFFLDEWKRFYKKTEK